MPEFRKDPVVGRWVIIAPERANRPSDFAAGPRRPRSARDCPFCPGRESATPSELLAGRPWAAPRDAPGWTYRVVPNRYPALRIEGELDRAAEGLHDRMNGIGAHEVLIETPEHDASLASMSADSVTDVLLAVRERMLDLRKDERLEYVLFFKNHGDAAGATLEHPHSQLIATPMVPTLVEAELAGGARHHDVRGRCVWCDIRHQDRGSGRLIVEADGFAVLAPYAPRFAYETWILPSRHSSSFEESGVEDLQGLARTLGDLVRRMNRALDSPAYNLLLHTAPLRASQLPHYHWHLEVIPKLTTVAGFEWGAGLFIHTTTPEDSAARLRESGE
jgi:UDPglucose--hexose-1-phosphate uridylyltransferase